MKKFLLVMLIVAVTMAYADDSKISPDLRNYPSTQKVQVVVQYAPGHAAELQRPAWVSWAALLNEHSETRRHDLRAIAACERCGCRARRQRHRELVEPVQRGIHQR